MSKSENKARNLHRSKSATSVKERKKHPLPSQPLDPETSRVHALIAARRAMDRSQSRSSADVHRSDSSASRRTTGAGTRSHVRFSPATQLRRQRSALHDRAPRHSAALRVPSGCSQDDPYADIVVTEFREMPGGYGSEPSSYRRLRRARSMLTPRRRLFSNPGSPDHTPMSQAPTLRTAASSMGLAQPGFGLRVKKSFTFLRPSSRVSIPQRPDTHIGHHDEAVRLARTQFLSDMQDNTVKKKSSLLVLPKLRPSNKAFRKSVRSSHLRDTDESLLSDTPSLEIPKLVKPKRSFSASLRDRVNKVFGRSMTNRSPLPPQQLEATRQHFSEINDIPVTSSFDNYHVGQDDDRRESFYVPSRDEQNADEERDRFSPTLQTAGSRESLHSTARSRVTSWTNSSTTTSTVRGPGLERNRLSIIKEDGGPHEPSCSAGRHLGGISVFQDPLETENSEGRPYPPVDSQRVYSALLKRIGEEEAELEFTQAALEEIHESRYGNCDPFSGNSSTVRAVSSTTVGTSAADRTRDEDTDDRSPTKQQLVQMNPATHQDNVERHQAKLISQDEQSSFYPFSDQGKAQATSPFRKLLEQRRSQGPDGNGFDNTTVEAPHHAKKPPTQKLTRGRFGLSSESIYSQTTNGGENSDYMPPIDSSDELAAVAPEVDEDTGMATIIPARHRPSEGSKLPSADSNERREWRGWVEGELEASLGRRDYLKAGFHHREHAQIDPEDVLISRCGAPGLGPGVNAVNRFPLFDLKEVPRNHTPVPGRRSSLTKSQSGLLKKASDSGIKTSSDRHDENKKIGSGLRKLSPVNLTNMLKEKKSQILTYRADDTGKENKPSTTTDSPRSSSPPMSTPGRLGLQMGSGNGRLRKRVSHMAVRTKHQVTPKIVSTPLRVKGSEFEESPTDRVKQSLSARLSRPFNMDVPEPNRPFDSMFLGKQEPNLSGSRLSTAPNAMGRRSRGYGGLGPNPFDAEKDDTALPRVRTPSGTEALDTAGSTSEKGKSGWSSRRMVSDFLKRRRQGRSGNTEDSEPKLSKEEGYSPAFV